MMWHFKTTRLLPASRDVMICTADAQLLQQLEVLFGLYIQEEVVAIATRFANELAFAEYWLHWE